ncbi:MAG TPA: hypothetical protein VGV38_02155, partial [Pyrinomonadaceae bacterium]|nr:hypothetical protein [Pyrinomonadaceae bacterium]
MSVTTSESIRRELVEALRLDLVGPTNDHVFARELLRESPTRWYLTGFLVPSGAPADQRTDATATEEIDAAGEGDATDDASTPDRAAARRTFLPSSMGLSVLVGPDVSTLQAIVSWGDYVSEGGAEEESAEAETGTDQTEAVSRENEQGSSGPDGAAPVAKRARGYRRVLREETVSISLPPDPLKPTTIEVPRSDGLVLVVTTRAVSATAIGSSRLPDGTRSVSVFLVNRRRPHEKNAYRAFVFQTELRVTSEKPFVARPDLRGGILGEPERDDDVADLQYRDVCEFAVGHGVSAAADKGSDHSCSSVRTAWIPAAEVEWVAPAVIPDVELGMEALASLGSGTEAAAVLRPLVAHYRDWIEKQRTKYPGLDSKRARTASDLLTEAGHVATRIERGIELLADPD